MFSTLPSAFTVAMVTAAVTVTRPPTSESQGVLHSGVQDGSLRLRSRAHFSLGHQKSELATVTSHAMSTSNPPTHPSSLPPFFLSCLSLFILPSLCLSFSSLIPSLFLLSLWPFPLFSHSPLFPPSLPQLLSTDLRVETDKDEESKENKEAA